jgi:hypothetical protein
LTKARRRSILNELNLQVEGSLIRKALAASILGAFALAMTPVVVHAADMPKSYKSVKAKKKPVAKKPPGAGMPQSKQMRMQANPPGSRFPYSYR